MIVYIVTEEFKDAHQGNSENGYEPPFRQLITNEWVLPVTSSDNLSYLKLQEQGFETRFISNGDFKVEPEIL